MKNTVFGKCMEDVRKRRDICLCCNEKRTEKLIAKPHFHKRNMFSPTLSAVRMRKTDFFSKKPIIISMTVLDISKTFWCINLIMNSWSWHINKMWIIVHRHRFFHIFTQDIYDMSKSLQRFDTSDNVENNVYGMPAVKKEETRTYETRTKRRYNNWIRRLEK